MSLMLALFIISSSAAVLALLGDVLALYWHHQDRKRPRVTLASRHLGQLVREDLGQLVMDEIAKAQRRGANFDICKKHCKGYADDNRSD